MAQRDKRIRAYADEKQLLEDVREERYDRPEDVPLGEVIGDLAREWLMANGGEQYGNEQE